MKALLYTLDGKQYSEDYLDIFSGARVELNDGIKREVRLIRDLMEINSRPTLGLLLLVANDITAYNEMSSVRYFFKTSDF